MSTYVLPPKYRVLLDKLSLAARDTWENSSSLHSTLTFVVGVESIPGLMKILASVLSSGRYASCLFFKDWESGYIHCTIIDPQAEEEVLIKSRCSRKGIELVQPKEIL